MVRTPEPLTPEEQAVDIDRLMEEVLPQEAHEPEPTAQPLSVLLGDFQLVQNGLYAKPPKIKQQRAIIQAIRAAQAAEDELDGMERLLDVATTLFYLPDGGEFRPVTREELEDGPHGFTIVGLFDAVNRLLGMEPNQQGN